MPPFKLLFLSLILLCCVSVFAQKKTTIIFRYQQDSLKQDSFYFALKKPLGIQSFGENFTYPDKIISFKRKKQYFETIYQYDVKDTSCAFLHDGFGYKTFLIPGDTLIVNINSGERVTNINNKYPRPWFHDITLEGKNKFTYALFDSLAFVGGALGWSGDIAYSRTRNLPDFCKLVYDRYNARLLFLENYCHLHSVKNTIKELAVAEIYSAFISNLIAPLSGKAELKNYPPIYSQILLKASFTNPSLYFKTSLYSSVAYSYSSLVLRKNFKLNSATNDDLVSIYNTIKQNYQDGIRNHMLTLHLSYYLGNPNLFYPASDSLLADFKAICNNVLYRHFLDSSYAVKKAEIIKKYNIEDAMSSEIINKNGQISTIKSLLKSKPVLIIGWASWCIPCIREVPFEEQLQSKYGQKIDFIYLSFDKNKSAWEDKAMALGINVNNYLMSKYFNSEFAHFYEISSIPRYFLYDKNGKTIDIKDLRPSDKGFESVLNKLIN